MRKFDLDAAERAYKARTGGQAPKAGKQPKAAPDPAPDPAAVPPSDGPPPLPGNNPAYIEAGVADQLTKLAEAAPGTRNEALFVAGKALGRLEAVDRDWLQARLFEAAKINGLLDDDGLAQTRKTIKSAFKAADAAGPRDVPDGPEYFATVTEVPMSTLRPRLSVVGGAAGTNGSGPAAPASAAAGGSGGKPPPVPPRDSIFDAEGDFWERESLARIRDAALMKMTPPWGVLAHCVARALYRVPPSVQLQATIGGPGSLNWFAALAAPSGGGKSSSSSVAALLVPGVSDDAIRNMGSGEGIGAQYRPPPTKNGPNRNVDALIFHCEEVETMSAMRDRQGSTTMSTLRNAFMGDPIGHSYVKTANVEGLVKHGYRMTLLLGVQPKRAGALLDDRYSGTLQRFQWFPAFDPKNTKAAADPSGFVSPLQLPTSIGTSARQVLAVPAGATDEILTEAERRAQGRANGLDGHVLFVRLKFAFGLAVLDNRIVIDDDDWRLAGIAMQISRATFEWVEREYNEAQAEIAGYEGRLRGLSRLAGDEARADKASELVHKCAQWAYKRLKSDGPTAKGVLTRSCDPPLRHWLDSALSWLAAEGYAESNKVGRAVVWSLKPLPANKK